MTRQLSRVALVLAMLLIVWQPLTFADDSTGDYTQQQIYQLGIHYYDVDTGGPASCTAGDDSLVGNDKVQQIMNYFVGQGLTAPQAAGLAGNIQSETAGTFDPSIVEGGGKSDTIPATGGYGLAQWTSPGRKQNLQAFATQEGLPVSSMKLQLDFIWHELSTSYNDSTLTPLKASTTVDDASDIILAHYETSQDYLDNGLGGRDGQARRHNSEVILASYGAPTDASTTSTATASSSDDTCGSGTGGGTATAGSGFVGNCVDGTQTPAHCGQCVAYVEYVLSKHADPSKGPYSVLTDQSGSDYHAAESVVPNLGKKGFTVNTTPAVHATFIIPASVLGNGVGHTGIVSQVNTNSSGTVTSIVIEESNWSPPDAEMYDTRTLTAAQIQSYQMKFAHTEVGWR